MSYQQQSNDETALLAGDQDPDVNQTSEAGKRLDSELNYLEALRFGSDPEVGAADAQKSTDFSMPQPPYFPSNELNLLGSVNQWAGGVPANSTYSLEGLDASGMLYGQQQRFVPVMSQDTIMSENMYGHNVNPTNLDNFTGNVAPDNMMVPQWSNAQAEAGQNTALTPRKIYPAIPAGTSNYSAGPAGSASASMNALSNLDADTRSKLKALYPYGLSMYFPAPTGERYIFKDPQAKSMTITILEPSGNYSFYLRPMLTIDVQASGLNPKGLFRTRVYNEEIDGEKGREMTLAETADSVNVQNMLTYANDKLKMSKVEEALARSGLLEQASQSWEARLRSCDEMDWAEGWNVSCGTANV